MFLVTFSKTIVQREEAQTYVALVPMGNQIATTVSCGFWSQLRVRKIVFLPYIEWGWPQQVSSPELIQIQRRHMLGLLALEGYSAATSATIPTTSQAYTTNPPSSFIFLHPVFFPPCLHPSSFYPTNFPVLRGWGELTSRCLSLASSQCRGPVLTGAGLTTGTGCLPPAGKCLMTLL